jgi:hypothetical protein
MVQLRWNPALSLRCFATLFLAATFLSACARLLPHSYLTGKAFHTSATWGNVLLVPLTAAVLLGLIEAGSLVFNSFVTLDAAHAHRRWVSPADGPFRIRRRPPAWNTISVALLGFLSMLLEYFSALNRLS